jgi:hypothetical protein
MDATTLVFLAGGATWVGVFAWAIVRWRRTRVERARERSVRLEQLIGPALLGAARPVGLPEAAALPGAAAASAGGAAPDTAIDPVRLAQAMLAAQGAAAGRPAVPAGHSASARTAAGLMPESALLRVPPFRMRERLLDKPATLALYAIRTAVPDHEVFARVSLAELLDVPEPVHVYDRAQRLKKLAPLTVDFAIANKAMQLVAVIDLEDAHMTAEQRELQRAKAEYLRDLPVRHLTFARARLPRYQDIRQLLLAAA